jgi:MinD superfamily P-loop ATPase
MSGLHDTQRAVELVRGFKIPVSVIINKWDINPDVAARVAEFCEQIEVPLLGRIPYDVAVVKAMVRRRTPVEDGQNAVEQSIRDIWETIESKILSPGG